MIDDPVVYDKAVVEGATGVLNADHSIAAIIEGKNVISGSRDVHFVKREDKP